jgi:hypothetical protein
MQFRVHLPQFRRTAVAGAVERAARVANQTGRVQHVLVAPGHGARLATMEAFASALDLQNR